MRRQARNLQLQAQQLNPLQPTAATARQGQISPDSSAYDKLRARWPRVRFEGDPQFAHLVDIDPRTQFGADVVIKLGKPICIHGENTTIGADARIEGGTIANSTVKADAIIKGGHIKNRAVIEEGAVIEGGTIDKSTIQAGTTLRGGYIKESTIYDGAQVLGGTIEKSEISGKVTGGKISNSTVDAGGEVHGGEITDHTRIAEYGSVGEYGRPCSATLKGCYIEGDQYARSVVLGGDLTGTEVLQGSRVLPMDNAPGFPKLKDMVLDHGSTVRGGAFGYKWSKSKNTMKPGIGFTLSHDSVSSGVHSGAINKDSLVAQPTNVVPQYAAPMTYAPIVYNQLPPALSFTGQAPGMYQAPWQQQPWYGGFPQYQQPPVVVYQQQPSSYWPWF